MISSACVSAFNDDVKIEEIIDLLYGHKYEGVELLGKPDQYHCKSVLKYLKERGMLVTALTACSRLKMERDLVSKDSAKRKTMEHYVKCIDIANELSAPLVGVTPTSVGIYCIKDDFTSE
jgi:sugar phosphate isomerase/epimerase